jgi:hypothetical protein
VIGREAILTSLGTLVEKGRTALLYGPVGIGKTVVLRELRRRVERQGYPCGFAPRTRTLHDLTAALAQAYPGVGVDAPDQRHLRSALGVAVEGRPGVLLLDHVGRLGTAARGFLRSLHGTGLGVIVAADVEHERDHTRVRALRLTHVEIALPPFGERAISELLGEYLATRPLPHRLDPRDRGRLVDVTAGRPGWVAMLAARLPDRRYWAHGRVLAEVLRADVAAAVAEQYAAAEAGDPESIR